MSYDGSLGFADALRGKVVGSGLHRESELLRKVVAPVLSLVLFGVVYQQLKLPQSSYSTMTWKV